MLHAEYLAPEIDIKAITDGSAELQDVAQNMVEQIAGNQDALRAYGNVLSQVATQLGRDRTLDGLIQAVTTLTVETAEASERNRALEQKLSASAAHIARLKSSLAEVKQEATTDGLTGLCNRKAFDAKLRRIVSRTRTDGSMLSLLMLDIDHFKRFNDTYGHPTGDLVLRLVAHIVADNVKGRDTAARFGGEEFAVILAGADLRAATIVAGQIRTALDGKRLVKKGSRQPVGGVTVSVGVAQLRSDETTAALIGRADAALYRAKHLGRNKVCTEVELAWDAIGA
ncbi:MAG: GGDEF domain-containing protein [Mycobacterium sp.]